MRRTAVLMMTVAMLVVALSGEAVAAVSVDEATAGGDYIKGTARADTIHGLVHDQATSCGRVRCS